MNPLQQGYEPRPVTELSPQLVGVARFELATSCAQSMNSTRLKYTPLRLNGGPNGIRTHVFCSTGRCPRPKLDDEAVELVDGIEPPSGTYKDPARPTQLHQLGGEGPSRTATVIRRQVYSLLSSPLHSLPNYLSNHYNKIPFHCQDKS